MRTYLTVLCLVALFLIPWVDQTYPGGLANFWNGAEDLAGQTAAVILAHHPKSVADIQANYVSTPASQAPKVRILLVPGHEPDYGGTGYKGLKERDMNVELAQDLQGFLNSDQHYQAFITRDTRSWNPTFADYFKDSWDDIVAWQKASHAEESKLIQMGSVPKPVSSVRHITAPADIALRLYGVTKWANENDIDITLHIHFNDYPGHPSKSPGDYSGFTIYVPAAQYSNSSTTKVIAGKVFSELKKYNPVSDLPGESNGIVDEPRLIAIGADNTADSASMLIEYGYIYEQQFQDPAVRSLALKDLAYQTYLGLEDFFDPNRALDLSKRYQTLALPHSWPAPIVEKGAASPDIFALQTALTVDGEYPPKNQDTNDCPRTGKLGPCTERALQDFQRKYGITGEDGLAGTSTISKLNQLFSL